MIKLKNVSKYYYGKKVVTTGFSKINLDNKDLVKLEILKVQN